jgi:phospholipase C
MQDLSRRKFLIGAAGATAGAALVAACGNDDQSGSPGNTRQAGSGAASALPDPADAPFDTVVVVMMENRSFDHVLGWLPGADGRQGGLSFKDRDGADHATWRLAPDWQGCDYQDPFHTWQAMNTHLNDGACDGWLLTQPDGDLFPIGYYGEDDLPILSALAKGYTTFDRYFASMLGPTWPNRLYQLCATTDLVATYPYPAAGAERPVRLETAIFDRASAAGLTGAYYYSKAEPMTGLFASRRYDPITYEIGQFWGDAASGKLANVTFVDPDWSSHSEGAGLSNDFHPYGSVQAAEAFVGQVHDALRASPQWDRMVIVLNFDESGGFFDHVVPPTAEDDTVMQGPGPWPDLGRLGFRVPCIAMGPFAPQKIEKAGPYEHCSVLKMIEWRWDLEPMTLRDRTAKNLAEALDFSDRREPLDLPVHTPAPAEECTDPGRVPRDAHGAQDPKHP